MRKHMQRMLSLIFVVVLSCGMVQGCKSSGEKAVPAATEPVSEPTELHQPTQGQTESTEPQTQSQSVSTETQPIKPTQAQSTQTQSEQAQTGQMQTIKPTQIQPTQTKPLQIQPSVPQQVFATAVKNTVNLSWSAAENADGYVIYRKKKTDKNFQKIGTVTGKILFTDAGLKAGEIYVYKIQAYHKVNQKTAYSQDSKMVTVQTAKKGISTIRNFLKTALQPVGSTMYVWGGGWNKEDTGSGIDAVSIGVSPAWAAFAAKQDADYDYNKTKYQIRNGLDCSGYVGWTVYNILNTKAGNEGYVMKAKSMAKTLSQKGFGTYRDKEKVTDHCAGDIMSSACSDCSHVWIVLGECKDGSVVLLHASPPGVEIDGTVSAKGEKNSEAVRLARKYMQKYYPEWQKKYPDRSRPETYLSHYCQMRWDISGNHVMTDPDGYRNKSAAEILEDLFGE